jgi:hypothetical protein
MSEQASSLRKELLQQLTDAGNAVTKLNDQLTQEKLKLEQLKGAVFALDLLMQRQAAPEQKKAE